MVRSSTVARLAAATLAVVAGSVGAQPRILPPARQYHATYSLSCRASGNDIVLRNDGPGGVPLGTGVHWSWWGREGTYVFAQSLAGGGHEVVIPNAFPPLPRPAPANTPCTLTVSPPLGLSNPGQHAPLPQTPPSTQTPPAGTVPPFQNRMPVRVPLSFSLTCRTRFDPQSHRMSIWVANEGPVRVPFGTRLHWTLDFNQLHEEGDGVIAWPLPPGRGRSIGPIQHQYIPEGRPCTVAVAG
jgi:hypothetical protein